MVKTLPIISNWLGFQPWHILTLYLTPWEKIADLCRTSDLTGIPFHFPAQFPVSTVLPMRVLTAIQIYEADKYESCIDKVRVAS